MRQSRRCIRELLRVVVAGQCKSGVVEAEIKLGQLVLQHKLTQRLLLGKLVTKTQSVVEQAETHIELTCGRGLIEVHKHLVIVVAHSRLFSPHRVPGFVLRLSFDALQLHIVLHATLVLDVHAQPALVYHYPTLIR